MKKKFLGIASAVVAGTGLATGAAKFAVSRRPAMPTDPSLYALPVPGNDDPQGELRAVFFGVATVALTDGETTIMVDGFFSRPPAWKVLGAKIRTNNAAVDGALTEAGITDLAAVLVAHSHYDHALDSAAVAWRTGAKLVGSESTLNIGRGFGLHEEDMELCDLDEPMTFGRFKVAPVLSEHSPRPRWTGLITEPISTPARAHNYRMAQCYSFHVTHTSASGKVRRVLIHPSAGFRPGCLQGYRADVAFLGVGPLGKQSEDFRDEFWRETVEMVGARRVYPIHWDDFTLPLSEPLRPMPYLADDFNVTLEMLHRRQEADGIEFALPEAFATIDPFGPLAPRRLV